MQVLPRNAVRLLPGPFLDAQATALDYLLSGDVNAGLAKVRPPSSPTDTGPTSWASRWT
ncbi:hypothetical protein [Streptomyces vastus]|uniref:Uncharacterized protein n=1 Tax=Streptomyces vastus TaxID=285451 RepID=A0ABP6EE63_9ACTN